jgi:hypothetical protein
MSNTTALKIKTANETTGIQTILDSIFEEQHILEACIQGCIARINESEDEGIANGLQIQWSRFKALLESTTDVLWETKKNDQQ